MQGPPVQTAAQTWKTLNRSRLCFLIGGASSADLHVNGFPVGVEWRIKVPPQCGRKEVFITPADNLHPDEI